MRLEKVGYDWGGVLPPLLMSADGKSGVLPWIHDILGWTIVWESDELPKEQWQAAQRNGASFVTAESPEALVNAVLDAVEKLKPTSSG